MQTVSTFCWETPYIAIKIRREGKNNNLNQKNHSSRVFNASPKVSSWRRKTFPVIDRKWILSHLCSELYLHTYTQLHKEWVHHNMGMAVCKGWSHVSKPKKGVDHMDQSCSEDISSVPLLNHRKGRTQGTTVYMHPLPSVARTSCNCHILQEALIWGWNNLWGRLLSQNKINLTKLDVSFHSLVLLTSR